MLSALVAALLALAPMSLPVFAQEAPTPPRRPATLTAPPPQPTPGGNAPLRLTPDAAPPATAPSSARPGQPGQGPASTATAAPLSDDQALQRVQDYLNSFRTLIADFVQFGADGRRFQGKLFVHRPGRMRFEYQPPATIEVVSDGTTVAVRDKRLATQDNYLIGQTPLKFLLKETIDLRRDVQVRRVQVTPELIRVTVEDRSTLGGTSRITIHFDPRANALRQWVIVDPQGYETSVQVANLDTTRRPDPALFRINLERILEN
jgi:outer membrane lipoprotein-sorting protein